MGRTTFVKGEPVYVQRDGRLQPGTVVGLGFMEDQYKVRLSVDGRVVEDAASMIKRRLAGDTEDLPLDPTDLTVKVSEESPSEILNATTDGSVIVGTIRGLKITAEVDPAGGSDYLSLSVAEVDKA